MCMIVYYDYNNRLDVYLDVVAFRFGFAAEMVARWVQERTEVTIQIMRPPNYSATILIILLFAFIGVLLYVRYISSFINEQVTRGHNIVADGWAGVANPLPNIDTNTKRSKTLFCPLFDSR